MVNFAVGLVSVFVPIYLWQLDYSLVHILFFYFLESLYFIPLTFLMAPVFRRLTDKSMLLVSLPFFVLYFIGFSYLEQSPFLFYLIPLISVIKALLFNTGYHLDFASASDDEDLGKEIGLRSMISSLFSLVAPFLGGLIIGFVGFRYAFFASSVVLLVSVLPLMFFPKRHVSHDLSAKSIGESLFDKRLKYNTLSNIAYANEFIVGGVLWKLFLFLAIGSIEQFGGIISISLFVSAMVTFLAGILSDDERRKKVLSSSSSALSLIWGARLFVSGAIGATISHIALHLVYPALIVAWSREFYHLAKTSPHPVSYILGREVLLRISRVFFVGLLMVLASIFNQDQFFSISFVLAGIFALGFIYSNKQDVTVFEKK